MIFGLGEMIFFNQRFSIARQVKKRKDRFSVIFA